MMLYSTIGLLGSLAIVTSGFLVHTPAKNTVEDAHRQLNKKISCWQPIDSSNGDMGYELSDPVFDLCMYMPDPQDSNVGKSNGVDMRSDDYTSVLALFAHPIPGFGMLNVCLQEAFQFHDNYLPSQISLRCLCKRSGCNIPKGLVSFLEHNKLPMPETTF